MGRLVPFAAAALVTTGVFTWLAGPLLEAHFGTGALLFAYAALATAAGVMTYVLVRARTDRDRAEQESGQVEATIELDEGVIDEEMQELKERKEQDTRQ